LEQEHAMAIRATYAGGILRLLEPLDLPENTAVEIILVPLRGGASDQERGEAALIAAGLARPRPAGAPPSPPTPAELAEAARDIPPGTPLAQMVIEEREERC
jgi:predicted DNA-binding antitoxin AbrB/MazE fold protein